MRLRPRPRAYGARGATIICRMRRGGRGAPPHGSRAIFVNFRTDTQIDTTHLTHHSAYGMSRGLSITSPVTDVDDRIDPREAHVVAPQLHDEHTWRLPHQSSLFTPRVYRKFSTTGSDERYRDKGTSTTRLAK